MCEVAQATSYCPADRAHLCAICDDRHHSSSPLLGRHQRYSVEESPFQFGMCAHHPSEVVDCVCMECFEPLCTHCILIGHHSGTEKATHSLISSIDAYRMAVKGTSPSEVLLGDRRSVLKEQLRVTHGRLEEVLANFEAVQRRIDAATQNLVGELLEWKRRKVGLLQSVKRQLLTVLLMIEWLETITDHLRLALGPAQLLIYANCLDVSTSMIFGRPLSVDSGLATMPDWVREKLLVRGSIFVGRLPTSVPQLVGRSAAAALTDGGDDEEEEDEDGGGDQLLQKQNPVKSYFSSESGVSRAGRGDPHRDERDPAATEWQTFPSEVDGMNPNCTIPPATPNVMPVDVREGESTAQGPIYARPLASRVPAPVRAVLERLGGTVAARERIEMSAKIRDAEVGNGSQKTVGQQQANATEPGVGGGGSSGTGHWTDHRGPAPARGGGLGEVYVGVQGGGVGGGGGGADGSLEGPVIGGTAAASVGPSGWNPSESSRDEQVVGFFGLLSDYHFEMMLGLLKTCPLAERASMIGAALDLSLHCGAATDFVKTLLKFEMRWYGGLPVSMIGSSSSLVTVMVQRLLSGDFLCPKDFSFLIAITDPCVAKANTILNALMEQVSKASPGGEEGGGRGGGAAAVINVSDRTEAQFLEPIQDFVDRLCSTEAATLPSPFRATAYDLANAVRDVVSRQKPLKGEIRRNPMDVSAAAVIQTVFCAVASMHVLQEGTAASRSSSSSTGKLRRGQGPLSSKMLLEFRIRSEVARMLRKLGHWTWEALELEPRQTQPPPGGSGGDGDGAAGSAATGKRPPIPDKPLDEAESFFKVQAMRLIEWAKAKLLTGVPLSSQLSLSTHRQPGSGFQAAKYLCAYLVKLDGLLHEGKFEPPGGLRPEDLTKLKTFEDVVAAAIWMNKNNIS
eukprot:GHVU01027308.1.p1 GENE.GHVU01027308.1~~GHVU01027308.1.p1  ORF type:complete len:907 (+),score=172.29 GHVU01027308.1:383-3103(+)